METIIGFVVGYLVGSNEGRAGLKRLRESVNAIRRSPEVRRFAADAVNFAGSTARQAAQGGGLGSIGGSMARTLIDRATADSGRHEAAHPA